jgi:FkbM family methyltransferase
LNILKQSLYRKLAKKGFFPRHAAEVGVYHPKTSNIYDYVIQGVKCTLIEPDPVSIELIKNHFSGYENVILHEVAIFDQSGKIELVRRDASTFVGALASSPAIINDSYTIEESDKFIVEAKTFNEIDDGSIDLLSVDVEGSEWYVIKNMISRPMIISLETHSMMYVNPFIVQILDWMENNDYKVWYKTRSDTIFIKNNALKLDLHDAIMLKITTAYLAFIRYRKLLKKNMKSRP